MLCYVWSVFLIFLIIYNLVSIVCCSIICYQCCSGYRYATSLNFTLCVFSTLNWYINWFITVHLFMEICFSTASLSYYHKVIVVNGVKRILISGSIHYPRSTREVPPLLLCQCTLTVCLCVFFSFLECL